MLVSVALVGYKLSAFKRWVQIAQRRRELNDALELLRRRLEDEDLAAWCVCVCVCVCCLLYPSRFRGCVYVVLRRLRRRLG